VIALVFGFAVWAIDPGYYGTAQAVDWPNWRGPNHNGVSNETGWVAVWPKNGPKLLWKKSLGTGFCSMAVSNGRLYTMGNIKDNDILYCFEADTGKEIWKKSYPCPLFKKNHEGGPAATPTVDGDEVYTFSKNGDVFCPKAATGNVVWHRNLTKENEFGVKHPTWYFASSPFVIDNMVILNAGTNGIALNKADGSVIWQNGKGAAGYSTAVPFSMDGKKCVALFSAKEMVALVAKTGKVLWKIPWKTSYDVNAADAIITGDKMFLSSGYNKGCALFKIGSSDFTELWRNKKMRNHFNSCVLWKGYIYGVDDGSSISCLDFKTGEVKWAQKGFGKGSLMLADGRLIILSDRGKLAIAEASPAGFKELSSAQILTGKCWTVPVLANGRIYARNNPGGQLVCLDVSGKD